MTGIVLTFASYNIHKGVGSDRRRDPDRILAVLREIDADVVALQEADMRFGERSAILSRAAIAALTPYDVVPVAMRPESIGWHGNALLVRRGIGIDAIDRVPLPTLEPRGAVVADLAVAGGRLRVGGMHLDLSGLRRRAQLHAVMAHLDARGGPLPTVLMGDCNEWLEHGSLAAFGSDWRVLRCGRSFPARRPVARLDRVIVSSEWHVIAAGVHDSPLARVASDHLPVHARLALISTGDERDSPQVGIRPRAT